ncbi:MAG: multiheme c-type cytochrome, partial [Sedimenticola sp.]
MKIRTQLITILFGSLLFFAFQGSALAKDLDEDKKVQGECVGCHINVNPGIVKQHMDGPHANPKKAEDEVSCHDCHGTEHKTMQASLQSRDALWDIQVPKTHSIFDSLFMPRP